MPEHLQAIQSYWNARAGGFSDASMEELETAPAERWTAIFKEHLPWGCKVLDDGAGAGFFTLLLASMGYAVTSVDYSDGMLEQVRANLKRRDLQAETLQMDAQRLEFADGSFDAVVSRNVLWNLDHPEQAYAEAGSRGNDCHARHNREKVDFNIIERIAEELPMSRALRPAWDFSTLVACGFRDISVKIEGSPLPQRFLIVAKKGSGEADE